MKPRVPRVEVPRTRSRSKRPNHPPLHRLRRTKNTSSSLSSVVLVLVLVVVLRRRRRSSEPDPNTSTHLRHALKTSAITHYSSSQRPEPTRRGVRPSVRPSRRPSVRPSVASPLARTTRATLTLRPSSSSVFTVASVVRRTGDGRARRHATCRFGSVRVRSFVTRRYRALALARSLGRSRRVADERSRG